MRTIVKLAVLPAVLAAAALASFLTPPAGAAAPTDVAGEYAGKLAYKFYPLTEADAPARGSSAVTATATLTTLNLSLSVTVQTDGGPELYNLQGRYGLGRFWASGNGPTGQMSLSGTASGVPGRLRISGSGIVVNGDSLTAVKLTLKQQPI